MKRFSLITIIALLCCACADIEEPEVINKDKALDGWWYLEALYDRENLSSGEQLVFDRKYTAEDTWEWRHVTGTNFVAYELGFYIGYETDPETGEIVEVDNLKRIEEHIPQQMFTSLFMSPGPYGNCIPYKTNDDGDRLDLFSTMMIGDGTISCSCSGGHYSYDWIDIDTAADLNYDGQIDYYDMFWYSRTPTITQQIEGVYPTTFKVTNLWRRTSESDFQRWKNTLENL